MFKWPVRGTENYTFSPGYHIHHCFILVVHCICCFCMRSLIDVIALACTA